MIDNILWMTGVPALGLIASALVLIIGLRSTGKSTLERFKKTFDKDFEKQAVITDHALVRFENHRYDCARYSAVNTVRIATAILFCTLGMGLAPLIAELYQPLSVELRMLVLFGIIAAIIWLLPSLAERLFLKYDFTEEKYQKPQWERMQKIADRYGIVLVRSGGYSKNLTHLRTSLETLPFKNLHVTRKESK